MALTGATDAKVEVHRDPNLGILREAEAGAAVADLLRKHQISRPTFYLCKKRRVAWASRSCSG